MSPSPSQFRLKSDAAIARAPETACIWQSLISESMFRFCFLRKYLTKIQGNQMLLMSAFRAAMIKLAITGQNPDDLYDCSDVIPVPEVWLGPAVLPADKSMADLEHPVSKSRVMKRAVFDRGACFSFFLSNSAKNCRFPHIWRVMFESCRRGSAGILRVLKLSR